MWKKTLKLLLSFFLLQQLEAGTWLSDSDTSWEVAGNWSTGIVPNSPTVTATFDNAITAPRTVSVNTANQVQAMVFDSAFSYTIEDAGGSLTVGDTITFTSGSHTIAPDMSFGPTLTINQNGTGDCLLTGDLNGASLIMQGTGTGKIGLGGVVTMTTGITISSNVTLDAGHNLGTAPITLNGGDINATVFSTVNNDILVTADSKISSNQGVFLALNGVISGAGRIVFNDVSPEGGGIFFNGANTFTGGAEFLTRTATISTDTAFGTGVLTVGGARIVNTGDITLANNIVMVSNGNFVSTAATTFTLNGDFSGTGGLGFIGFGTTVLTGTSARTAFTSIRNGTVAITNNLALGTGQVIIEDNGILTNTNTMNLTNRLNMAGPGTITVPAGTEFTSTGALVGTGLLTINDTGTKTFTGTGTHTGGVILEAGDVFVGSDTPFGTSTISMNGSNLGNTATSNPILPNDITLNTNTSITTSPSTIFTFTGQITGANTLTSNGTGITVLSGANTYTADTQGTSGTLAAGNDTAFGTGNVILNGAVLSNTASHTLANNITLQTDSSVRAISATNLTLNGVISGANNLLLDGPGTTVLNSANTYTGGTTTISTGTAAAGNDAAFNTSNISLNTGTLSNAGGDRNLANTIVVDDDSFVSPITATTMTLNGVISGTNRLTFNGAGTTLITQANTYSGGSTLSSGITAAGNDTAFGSNNVSLNGGTLNNAGADRTLANTFSIDADSIITTDPTTTLTLDGVISGANNITFTGGGTTALAGTNIYTGNTSIGNGTISISNNTSPFGTGVVIFNGGDLSAFNSVVNNNITLNTTPTVEVLDISGTLALNGVISGGNGITFEGSGTKTLSGTNTNTGTTTIDGGSLVVANDAAFGTGSVVLNATVLTNSADRTVNNAMSITSPSTISADTATTFTFDGVISGANSLFLNGPGTVAFNQANTYAGPTTISAGTALAGNDAAFGTGAISLNGGDLTANANRTLGNAISVDVDSSINPIAATTLTLDGVISGSNNLTFDGPGTTVLNQANTYTGITTLTSGTTTAANNSSFGTGSISLNGGTLANVGNLTLGNAIAIDDNSSINPAATTTLTLDGVISGTNTLNFNGTGTTVLNQANTYSGATTISQGTTILGNDASFGTSTVSLNGGMITNNANRTINNLISIDADSTITTIASTTWTLNGVISGGNTLGLDGAGTTVLTAANTYTTATNVITGTVVAENDAAFGTSVVTLNAATLDSGTTDRTLSNDFSVTSASTIIPSASNTLTMNGVISGAGDITVAPGGNLALTGSNTSSGTISLQNDVCSIDNDNAFGTSPVTFDGATLTVANALTINNNFALNQDTTVNPITQDLTLAGNVTGTGLLTVSGTPGSTQNLTLSGINTYSGGTVLTDLRCDIEDDAGLGTGAVTLNSTILGIQGTFVSTRNINLNTTTPGEKSGFLVSDNNVYTATSTMSATDGFIKSGPGELLIPSDQSTVAGTVSIIEGTFTINGLLTNATVEATGSSIITGNGSVGDTLVTDALLKGNGTYTNITMNSGMISPGDSIGTITITGNYVQNAGAIYEVELDTNTNDQIIVTGNATIQTGAILTVLEPIGTVLEGASYDILIANNINQLWSEVNLPPNLGLSLFLVEGDTIARLTATTSSSFWQERIEDGNPRRTADYINAIEITADNNLKDLVMSIESDPDSISDSLNQLHHARFGAFEITNVESNYGIISTIDRHQSSFGCAKNCTQTPNSIWVGVLGTTASRGLQGELRGSDNKDIGGILGYDYCLANNMTLGVSGGYLHTDLDWDSLGGNAKVQKGFGILYTAYNHKRFQGMLCLMGGANFYDINRRIAFMHVDRIAKSRNTAGFFSSNFGAKVDLLGTSTTLIGQGNISYHYLSQGNFEETGVGSVSLIIDPRTSHFLRSQLGVQISGKIESDADCIRYYAGGNWVNKTLLNDDNFSAKFLAFKNENPVLTVRSNDQSINGFLAEAGITCSTNTNQLSIAYQGEFYKKDQNHQIQAVIGFNF